MMRELESSLVKHCFRRPRRSAVANVVESGAGEEDGASVTRGVSWAPRSAAAMAAAMAAAVAMVMAGAVMDPVAVAMGVTGAVGDAWESGAGAQRAGDIGGMPSRKGEGAERPPRHWCRSHEWGRGGWGAVGGGGGVATVCSPFVRNEVTKRSRRTSSFPSQDSSEWWA